MKKTRKFSPLIVGGVLLAGSVLAVPTAASASTGATTTAQIESVGQIQPLVKNIGKRYVFDDALRCLAHSASLVFDGVTVASSCQPEPEGWVTIAYG